MFAKAIFFAALLSGVAADPITKCAEDFVANCLSTADQASCLDCVKGFPNSDCSVADSLVFGAVCTKAPYTTATEDCINEVVKDCSPAFTSKTQCAECILLHTADLKSANCTTAEVAGATALCSQISVEAEADASFRTFLTTYNKEYKNATEFAYRLDVFKKNLQIAEERNADGEAVHGITKFSDLTNEEFRSFYLGYKAPTGARQELDIALTDSSEAASVDWRGHSPAILTPVKNQAQCGSCWAFSATEQIETNYAMAGNAIPSLSVQQIVSCDKVDEGCNGGNTETAYAYVEKAGGLETEASYPYTSGKGKSGICKDKKAKEVVAIKGFNTISKSEASEKKMVTQMGDSPISVCVDATKWQTYKKGILGRTCGKQLDHCVQAVGLNTDGAKPYWIVRNSWASDWGVDGYIYVEEGINACGIAKDATTVNI